jgi:SOS response regulatory protein OraA/RecX
LARFLQQRGFNSSITAQVLKEVVGVRTVHGIESG